MTVLLSGAENMISSSPARASRPRSQQSPLGMMKFNKNVFLQYLRINLADLRQQIKHEPGKRRWRILAEKEIFEIKTKPRSWRNKNVVLVEAVNFYFYSNQLFSILKSAAR